MEKFAKYTTSQNNNNSLSTVLVNSILKKVSHSGTTKDLKKATHDRRKHGLVISGTVMLASLNTNIQVAHRFQWFCTTGGTYTITQLNLLAAMVMAVSSTNAWSLIYSMRVKKIAILTEASGGTPQDTSISWANADGPGKSKMNTSTDDFNILMTSNPPMNSLDSFWFSVGSSNNLFQLTIPTNGIVQISVDLIFRGAQNDTENPSAITISGGSAGKVYGMGLDGLPQASSKFAVVGLTQI